MQLRIFVSSENVDRPPASRLIARLREEGWCVDHSPRNPSEGPDARWGSWYQAGSGAALDEAGVFIIALNQAWAGSTWMAEEAPPAIEVLPRRIPHVFYWNPENISVAAPGLRRYLREQLPDDLEALVARLRALEAA